MASHCIHLTVVHRSQQSGVALGGSVVTVSVWSPWLLAYGLDYRHVACDGANLQPMLSFPSLCKQRSAQQWYTSYQVHISFTCLGECGESAMHDLTATHGCAITFGQGQQSGTPTGRFHPTPLFPRFRVVSTLRSMDYKASYSATHELTCLYERFCRHLG
jgi:hypothetical protein